MTTPGDPPRVPHFRAASAALRYGESRTSYRPAEQHPADDRDGPTARLVRAALRSRSVDLLPLARLGDILDIGQPRLRAAVGANPDLGLCGPPRHPLIWTLAPAPMAAGFRPTLRDGRLILRLTGPRRLLVTGHRLGAAPPGDGGGPGQGELAHTVGRLTTQAARWLIMPTPHRADHADRTRRLFELVAATWRLSPVPVTTSGPLRIHHAEHPAPVASRF